MYKPLPKNLTLGESEIHDIGLFAKENIKRGHELGISHIQVLSHQDNAWIDELSGNDVGKELYRTPLGGFINHADEPNCIKSLSLKTKPKHKVWRLTTLRDIEEGEELTVKYTFYKI